MLPMREPLVSVLMPVYNQASFVCRALESLLAQDLDAWELRIVDDGSTDATADLIQPYLSDPRITCQRLDENHGLGAALNIALDTTATPLIAYLPADDVFYSDHLSSLLVALTDQPDAVAACAAVRHHYNKSAAGQIDGECLQLVQMMHRRTSDRWVERRELESDDLERLFWRRLRPHGRFVGTGQLTCEWVDHPSQRHKVMREPVGGINPFRQRYNITVPLRFHTTMGNRIDEVDRYRAMRERPDTPTAPDGLKILLVGELAYNADRVLALEERGHRLYGLWMPDPYWYNTVGPLPFGHVTDLPRDNWQDAIRQIQPDVIYALLNWQAVPFAHQILTANTGVPFVWHFKEGPFICLEHGVWDELIALTTRSDGQIYSSPELRDWFATIVPGVHDSPSLVLDGDLPKRDWFTAERSPRLSQQDGQLHTVVPGRPIGMHPWLFKDLAGAGVHLHFYGDFTHGQWKQWITTVTGLAPGFLHLHPQVDQENWVREFSQYDAGWLHFEPSANHGDIRRANWDDLNYPARMATLAVAGLPMLQFDNSGHTFATQTLVRERDLGLFFTTMDELATLLRHETRVEAIRDNVWRTRDLFTFDAHVDALIQFFRTVIEHRGADLTYCGQTADALRR